MHFYTHTTIDTLDYSGTSLNSGSKVVFAAYGDAKRNLCKEAPWQLKNLQHFKNAKLAMPGIVCIETKKFSTYNEANTEMEILNEQLKFIINDLQSVPFIIICDDSEFVSYSLSNFLWISFTRCNPSHDIYGIDSFYENKHWGCKGSLIIDARIKPHHAPVIEKDPLTEKKIERFFNKGGSLYKVI